LNKALAMKNYLLLCCCLFCLHALGQISVVKRVDWVNPPEHLTVLGNALYFIAADQFDRIQLWRSDGTAAGTQVVKELGDLGIYHVETMLEVRGNLFLVAFADASGKELWISDGTAVGTRLLKDIYPGNIGANPEQLTRVGNLLFFSADEPNAGRELWKSDGTNAGTVLVKDLNPGENSSRPQNLIEVGGALYCSAMQNSTHQLYKSDGTATGTVPLKSFARSLQSFAKVGNTLYFTATERFEYNQLWKSNGEASNTIQVQQLCSDLTELKGVGTQLYFYGKDCATPEAELELLLSNGTANGTRLLKDINLDDVSYVRSINALGNQAIFVAEDQKNGTELWRSDGTLNGTFLLKDINEGNAHSNPEEFIVWGNELYFTAETSGINSTGRELWRSNGTIAGTYLLKDISPGEASSAPEELTLVDNNLFFTAFDSTGYRQLWKIQEFIVPTCALPESYSLSIAKITTQTATLNSGLSTYTSFQFGYRKVGSNDWKEQTTSFNTNDIQGLTPNTDYEFRVKVQCSNQLWSDWSVSSSFRTLAPTPVDSVLTFYMERISGKPGDTLYLPIRVNQFKTMGGFQFSVNAGSTDVRILEIIPALAVSTLQSRQHSPQLWSLAWYDSNVSPQDFEDATLIATCKIVIDAKVSISECVQVLFATKPTDIVASKLINNEITELKPQTRGGEICMVKSGVFAETLTDFNVATQPLQVRTLMQHRIVPNPSLNDPFFQFETQYSGICRFEVLNLAGQVIRQFSFITEPGQHKVPLQGLSGSIAAGVYLYRAHFNNAVLAGKFLMLK